VEAAPCKNTMSRKKATFWAGLAIYAVSFALVAVADRWPGHDLIRGWADPERESNLPLTRTRATLLRSAAIGPVWVNLANAHRFVHTVAVDDGHSVEASIEQTVVDQLVLFDF
jgi:hypothetical protein